MLPWDHWQLEMPARDLCQCLQPLPQLLPVKPQPCMQDELTLIRQELRLVQQKRREEGAKQEPNDRLLEIYAADIHNLTAREERLMEEARAMRLEAHPPGEQFFQSACLTVVESVSVEAWKSSVGEAACPGNVNLMSSTVRREDEDLRLLSCL